MEDMGISEVQIFITAGVYLPLCIRLSDRIYSILDINFQA